MADEGQRTVWGLFDPMKGRADMRVGNVLTASPTVGVSHVGSVAYTTQGHVKGQHRLAAMYVLLLHCLWVHQQRASLLNGRRVIAEADKTWTRIPNGISWRPRLVG